MRDYSSRCQRYSLIIARFFRALAFISFAFLSADFAVAQSKTVNGINISDTSISQAQRGVFYTYNIAATTSGPTPSDSPYTRCLTDYA